MRSFDYLHSIEHVREIPPRWLSGKRSGLLTHETGFILESVKLTQIAIDSQPMYPCTVRLAQVAAILTGTKTILTGTKTSIMKIGFLI